MHIPYMHISPLLYMHMGRRGHICICLYVYVKPSMETNVLWGSLAKPPQRAHPPSNFLVGADLHAVARCCHEHHPWIQSELLCDRKGEGNEKNRVEKHECDERESIVCTATSKSKRKENKTTTRVNEATFYSNSPQWKE